MHHEEEISNANTEILYHLQLNFIRLDAFIVCNGRSYALFLNTIKTISIKNYCRPRKVYEEFIAKST